MVTVSFSAAIMPRFLLLAVLNTHVPEKFGGFCADTVGTNAIVAVKTIVEASDIDRQGFMRSSR
jgi:hypothetical protein